MDLIDIGIYAAYLLFFVATAAMIVLPLIQAMRSPKNLIKSAIGIGALVLLFLIAFLLSGGEHPPKWEQLGVNTEFGSKMIGAGLMMFYFVLIIAVIGMIYSEISKAFK